MMPPTEIVGVMLGPLCYEKRFAILKTLTGSMHTFSFLSLETGVSSIYSSLVQRGEEIKHEAIKSL